MNMKINNILLVGMSVMTTIGLTGCKDSFLEVENENADPIEEYYTTDAHVKEALVAAYNPLRWPDWSNGEYDPINLASDVMSDNMNVGGQSNKDVEHLQMISNYGANATHTLAGLWIDEYAGVKLCNDVIAYVEKCKSLGNTDVTADNATYYETCARVLRAYYYMNLWKFWGNIPYYTTNLSGNFFTPQLTADEVYKNVIADLEDAISVNVLPMRADASEAGKVTKAFAYMVYAEMVMYQNDESRYGTALKYMTEIINSGKYELVPDYASIWDETGEWSSESIYEVNYNDDNNARGYAPGNNPLAVGGTVLPRMLGPRAWTAGVDGVDAGWGIGPVRQETYDMFSAKDARRDATCYNATAVAKANGFDYEHAWEDTGFFLYKYLPRTANVKDALFDKDLNFNNNLRIYRYAETLLNAAELSLRTGGTATGDALKWLNKVHQRAGLDALTAATVDDVITERHLEFVGEGKRYWDLVRTGQAVTVLVANSAAQRTTSWTENKKYLPIPQIELSADPNLKQNNY
jgi:hypothetical protein